MKPQRQSLDKWKAIQRQVFGPATKATIEPMRKPKHILLTNDELPIQVMTKLAKKKEFPHEKWELDSKVAYLWVLFQSNLIIS